MTLSLPGLAQAHDGIHRLTNEFRQENARKRLRTNDHLNWLARRRARQIVGDFSHQFWWGDRTRCRGTSENIAYRIPAVEGFKARWFVSAWIGSDVHRRNMLGQWDRMGSAIYVAPNGGMYGVQLFCRA